VSNANYAIIKRLARTSDGQANMNVDGSVTPQVFEYMPPADNIAMIARLILHVRDTGSFAADGFGALGNLANGVELDVYDATVGLSNLSITNGLPVKSNAGWSRIMYDVRYDSYGGGPNFLSGRFTFANFLFGGRGAPGLGLAPNSALRCVVNDDLTGLDAFYVTVEGEVLQRSNY
jgi:hypothetical protein